MASNQGLAGRVLTHSYLHENYVGKQKSLRAIAVESGFSVPTVRNHLVRNNIRIIGIKERNTKKINASFFDALTPESAFVLGYILMDGDLQLNRKAQTYFIRLYSKYENQLELVRSLLDMEGKIQFRPEKIFGGKKSGALYFIHIANQQIVKQLLDFGMVANKKQQVKFPEIPKEFIKYFLRGCWTGSGSVNVSKRNVLSVTFTISSLPFIKTLVSEIHDLNLTKGAIYENKASKSPSYYTKYLGEKGISFLSRIYDGTKPALQCMRQVRTFNEFVVK